MPKAKSMVLLLLSGAVSAYLLVAVSPMKQSIGRTSPELASWFSLPLGNFDHTYLRGRVLSLQVGMTKSEALRELVTQYAGIGKIIAGCDSSRPDSHVELTPNVNLARVLAENDRLCMRLRPRLSAILKFEGGTLASIRISFVRNELP